MLKMAQSDLPKNGHKLGEGERGPEHLPRKPPQLQDSLTAVILDTNADKEKEKKIEQGIEIPQVAHVVEEKEKD
jgi:hypothetical protein